jgi:hypothetical protein
MSQRSFIQSQILEIENLLRLAEDHPLMSPGLHARKAALEAELRHVPPESPEAKTIMYFTGLPVFGSFGIDAEFASRVLGPFSRMVKSHYSSEKHGAVGARGPRRDEFESKLMLTALPRGSFGLELRPVQQDKPENTRVIGKVLQQLSRLIESSGANDDLFAEALSDVAPRTLAALQDLLRELSDRQADLRLVTGQTEIRMERAAVGQALERVSATLSQVKEIRLAGVFRGLTLESWRFDFRLEDGDVISGRVGDEVDDPAAAEMVKLTNQKVTAVIRVTTVVSRGGRETTRNELIDLIAIAPDLAEG